MSVTRFQYLLAALGEVEFYNGGHGATQNVAGLRSILSLCLICFDPLSQKALRTASSQLVEKSHFLAMPHLPAAFLCLVHPAGGTHAWVLHVQHGWPLYTYAAPVRLFGCRIKQTGQELPR